MFVPPAELSTPANRLLPEFCALKLFAAVLELLVLICPVALSVVNAPVEGVVAPTGIPSIVLAYGTDCEIVHAVFVPLPRT